MTPQEASNKFGATHYTTMKDGKTPQMYYKYVTIYFNDGTYADWLHYLSFCNIWMGSGLVREYTPAELDSRLIKI